MPDVIQGCNSARTEEYYCHKKSTQSQNACLRGLTVA